LAAELAAAGLGGALIALVAVALVDPQARLTHIDAVVITVGIFAGIGLDRMLRG
jgi:hypothetical protein